VDGSIQIWDIERRALVRTLAAKVPQWPTSWRKPLFSPDGRWLALTGLPQVWNLPEGRLEPGDSAPQLLRRDERILAISQDDRPFAISPDGRFVAIAAKAPVHPLLGSGTNIVNILDVSSGEQRGALANLPGLVRAIGWSGDGQRIHVVTDSDLSVWDVSAGLQRTSQRIPGPHHWAAFSRDGETVARCDFGKIALMSLVDGRWLQKEELHEAFSATDHALSPGGETLAIADLYGIQLWDVRSGKLRETLQVVDSDDRAEAIAYHPNGSVLAVVGWNGLYLHRLSDGASLRLTILTGADGNPVWWVSDGKGRWSGPPEAARLRRAGDDLRYGDLLPARQLPELGWRPMLLPDFIQPSPR
jgi:WD40 repeat protein